MYSTCILIFPLQAKSDDTDVDAIKREKDLACQLDETEQELKKRNKG